VCHNVKNTHKPNLWPRITGKDQSKKIAVAVLAAMQRIINTEKRDPYLVERVHDTMVGLIQNPTIKKTQAIIETAFNWAQQDTKSQNEDLSKTAYKTLAAIVKSPAVQKDKILRQQFADKAFNRALQEATGEYRHGYIQDGAHHVIRELIKLEPQRADTKLFNTMMAIATETGSTPYHRNVASHTIGTLLAANPAFQQEFLRQTEIGYSSTEETTRANTHGLAYCVFSKNQKLAPPAFANALSALNNPNESEHVVTSAAYVVLQGLELGAKPANKEQTLTSLLTIIQAANESSPLTDLSIKSAGLILNNSPELMTTKTLGILQEKKYSMDSTAMSRQIQTQLNMLQETHPARVTRILAEIAPAKPTVPAAPASIHIGAVYTKPIGWAIKPPKPTL